MKKSLLSMFLAILLLAQVPAQAKGILRTVEGTVVSISDGDTLAVEDAKGTRLKVRLYGIDAPETEKSNKRTGRVSKRGQPYGEEAFRTLEHLLARRKVRVDILDRDRYNRLVGLVWVENHNINREMVAEGYAWAYKQYLDAPYASEFISLEEQARKKRLGLWHQDHPQPPWEFRQSLNRSKHTPGSAKRKHRRS